MTSDIFSSYRNHCRKFSKGWEPCPSQPKAGELGLPKENIRQWFALQTSIS